MALACHRKLELARRALAIAIGLGDVSLQASVNYQLACIGHSTGDYRHSAEAFSRFAETLQGVRRQVGLVTAAIGPVNSRGRLAWCLAELGEFAEATAHAEEAVRIASEADHLSSLLFSCRSLGFVFLRRGGIPQAIPPLERAVELCRRAVPVFFDITAAHLGYAYALSGHLSEGVSLMEDALADPESTGTAFHPLLLAYLGEAHLLAGGRDDALEVARRALDLASADAHYGEARARADELGMRPLAAHCHLGLGKLYRGIGKREQAREHLATAATLYGEMDMGSGSNRRSQRSRRQRNARPSLQIREDGKFARKVNRGASPPPDRMVSREGIEPSTY